MNDKLEDYFIRSAQLTFKEQLHQNKYTYRVLESLPHARKQSTDWRAKRSDIKQTKAKRAKKPITENDCLMII